MRIEISTGSFHEVGVRASHLAQKCHWWVIEARAVQVVGVSGPALAAERMNSVAQRLELLGRNLHQLATAYADHEAQAARVLSPIVFAGLVIAGLPLLPFDAAALVAVLAGLNSSRETATTTTLSGTQATSAPTTLDELLDRIPQGDDQVRIDRVTTGTHVHYIVYVSGTRDFGLETRDQPWDMTSNITALRGEQMSGCEQAVRQAMAEAGIRPGDDVVLVGHSLGGLTATRIAQSHDFAVSDVVTVGAPTRSVNIPGDIRFTQLEYTNDLVPPLSGVAVATGSLMVRARFVEPKPSGLFGPHDITAYRQMAREIDRSNDPVLNDRTVRLLDSTRGERVESRWYRSRRN